MELLSNIQNLSSPKAYETCAFLMGFSWQVRIKNKDTYSTEINDGIYRCTYKKNTGEVHFRPGGSSVSNFIFYGRVRLIEGQSGYYGIRFRDNYGFFIRDRNSYSLNKCDEQGNWVDIIEKTPCAAIRRRAFSSSPYWP